MKSYKFSWYVLLFLVSCQSQQQQDKTIRLSGAFALYPLVVRWSREYQQIHPDIRFDISAGGAGKGMTDALSGTVTLGMFSRAITPEERKRGVWWIAVAKDAVIPTINAENPLLAVLKTRGLRREEFRRIYLSGEISNWNQLPGIHTALPIHVYTRSDACGAAGTWAAYLGGKQEEMKGIGIFGDPGLADAVIRDEKGVGFNNTIYLYNGDTGFKNAGIEIIPIDNNGNGKIDDDENFYDNLGQVLEAIAVGKYPSPPARELYLIARGRPQKKPVTDFLIWVVTKGQQFVSEAGYVPLSNSIIRKQVEKLNGVDGEQ